MEDARPQTVIVAIGGQIRPVVPDRLYNLGPAVMRRVPF